MGCITSKTSSSYSTNSSKTNQNHKEANQSIKLGKSRQNQGVHELKKNYVINNLTKTLGEGAFGKVFLTTNKQDASL